MRSIKTLGMVFILTVLPSVLFASPVWYVERVGGSDLTNAIGSFLFVIENPSNSEPLTKVVIPIPSGFSVSSPGGYATVLGRGIGTVSDISSSIVVDFPSPLMPTAQ